MRTDILERKEEILQWIEQNQSKAFICRELQCKPETLNAYLKQMGIEYAGNKGSKGLKVAPNYKTAEEYIKSSCVKSHILKLKLLRDGIKEYKCESCGMSTWLSNPIPLELHHKDGNHYNNEFDNLLLLCPTCHSLQNGNNGAKEDAKQKQEQYIYSETKGTTPKTGVCSNCGNPITRSSKSGMCKSCAAKMSTNRIRIVAQEQRPTREELKQLIRTKSFLEIGRMYGVSDNAIRKWCKTENLPSTKAIINSYSEEEWNLI